MDRVSNKNFVEGKWKKGHYLPQFRKNKYIIFFKSSCSKTTSYLGNSCYNLQMQFEKIFAFRGSTISNGSTHCCPVGKYLLLNAWHLFNNSPIINIAFMRVHLRMLQIPQWLIQDYTKWLIFPFTVEVLLPKWKFRLKLIWIIVRNIQLESYHTMVKNLLRISIMLNCTF